MIALTTDKVCIHCGKPATLMLPEEQAMKVIAWAEKGSSAGFIQDELKFLDNAQREMLITGTHPKCWDEMFPEEK
jgi:hypothetical protein